ncbi:hypothetical protein M747DRAFT_290932 [Aspergillus niger ATCC 13496]|uniref:Contig An08c0330, genomic contig n=3 Tax=Aspergillus niger TaxID=5061 RepID=A2QSV5_ASPNC|nr:uncharacterized protein An08g12070 [Aspergillus niger]RDH14184.1 hypothetical protein M747DRAFT_290932 [Aspergillus niger ATCC 13496]CAK40083.1 unnamed protein product [Aspergillus niger]
MASMFVPYLDGDIGERKIQTSESTFRRQRATDVERLDMGYLQVWLYAMRHNPLMAPDAKNDDDLLAKPVRAKADERAIYEMAGLARRLGFKSPEIDVLVDGSPDHQIARAALLQARKPNRFRYDTRQFDILVNRIAECFAMAAPYEPDIGHDLLADSTMKPRARCGMPRKRTHKQDSPLLFLDPFMSAAVSISFFGRSARPEPTVSDRAGESPGDIPRSPLFVGEDGPSGDHGSALQAALPRESPQQEQEQPQGQAARRDEEQCSLRRQQVPRAERKRDIASVASNGRRERRVRGVRPHGVGVSEHGALGSGYVRLSSQKLPDEGPQDKSTQSDPATALTPHPTHGPAALEEADAHSHCMRISLEATPLEQDSDNRSTVEDPPQDDGLEDQARIDHPSQPQSTEIEDGNSSSIGGPAGQQPVLVEYLDQLMRAQEEQGRLEEELEPQAAVPEPSQDPSPASHHEEQPEPPVENLEHVAPTTHDDASHPLGQGPPADDAGPPAPVEAPQPPAFVEVCFWRFEREEWKRSDRLRVDPSDPSPVERIARKYSSKNYSLYDRNLQSLSPAQCYRAATVDGNNAIFLISEHEEQRLAAEGRLTKDKQLLSLVSRVLDRAEPEPMSPTKRHRSMSLGKL